VAAVDLRVRFHHTIQVSALHVSEDNNDDDDETPSGGGERGGLGGAARPLGPAGAARPALLQHGLRFSLSPRLQSDFTQQVK